MFSSAKEENTVEYVKFSAATREINRMNGLPNVPILASFIVVRVPQEVTMSICFE